MKKLILIDAHALIHRVYHALPRLTSPKGELMNAAYGFSAILIKILKELKPDYILAAFDLPAPTFRHEEYKEYKATRVKAPDELYNQIPKIKEILASFGIPIYEKAGFEADDIIGTIVEKVKSPSGAGAPLGRSQKSLRGRSPSRAEPKIKNIIASGDLDTLQLVDENTEVFGLKKGISETITYDEKKVLERYGLKPEQIADFKGLKGDPSDNIPGVKGIGEKTASDLLKKYGSLENLYTAIEGGKVDISKKIKEKLVVGKDKAFFSKYLSTIKRDVPIDFNLKDCELKPINKEKVESIFKELGFFSLIKRLMENQVQGLRNLENFVRSQPNSAAKINIESESDFDNLVKDVSKTQNLAIYLDELKNIIEFSCQKDKIYILNISNLDKDDFFKILESILSDRKIQKIGFDLKTIFKFFLKNYGIWMEGLAFDIMIADYLLNPDKKVFNLDKILLKYLPDHYLPQTTKANFLLEAKEVLASKLKELELLKVFQDIEMPLIYVLAQMELVGIKINEEYFKKLDFEFEQKIKHIEDKIYDFAGIKFNINSPQQLAEIIFEKLKISSKGIKKTEKAKRISTQASELLKLKGRHEIIDLILEYRELAKLKTTYINSLLELRDSTTSRIFSSFSQVGTATGRLASSQPNLQNLPQKTEAGQKIRAGFIAEKNYSLVSFDYSQIELRIAASLANDEKMIAAFKEGKDIHKITASQIFNVKEEQVTDKMRNFAKTLNFGILYGMGAKSLAQSASMTQEEAQRFIEEYFSDFGGVAKFMEETKEKTKKEGFVKNYFGRIRYLPEILSGNFKLQRAAQRAAVNMPIQSLAADIIKLSMIEIFTMLNEEFDIKNKLKGLFAQNHKFEAHNLSAVFVMQIHDELVFEIRKEAIDELIPKIKRIMENIIKLKIPLVVEYSKGENLSDLK